MFVKNSSVTIETKDFAMLLAMLPSCGWKTINGKEKSMEKQKKEPSNCIMFGARCLFLDDGLFKNNKIEIEMELR